MALATETDARAAVVDMLDSDADDSDYTQAGSQPGTIEAVEESQRRTKKSLQADAIYVWKPADTEISKHGAAGSNRREVAIVQVECFSVTSAPQAHALKEDVISITGAFSNDSQGSTKFVDVFPIAETDARHEARTLQGGTFVEAVQVRLRRLDSV